MDGDGVGANGSGRDDGDTLATGNAVDGGLDSCAVVATRVELRSTTRGDEAAAAAGDGGMRGAGTALGERASGESEQREERCGEFHGNRVVLCFKLNLSSDESLSFIRVS